MTAIWEFRTPDVSEAVNVTGFDVTATDGSIGKIDEATYDAGRGAIVVDTGWWIFGKKRLIPAGAIQAIDLDKQSVVVGMTKDQIRNAPDYDETRREDAEYRSEVGSYYGQF